MPRLSLLASILTFWGTLLFESTAAMAGNFGREPLDVMFTAPPNTFTFLPQYTVAVVSNSISLATNCKTNASNTELQCKIDPQANGVVNVMFRLNRAGNRGGWSV